MGMPFLVLVPVLASVLASTALAEEAEVPPHLAMPPEMADIGIEERPGAPVARDVRLTNHEGREFTFGEYLDDGKPVILVLAYYQCPMLCTLVLNGIVDGLKSLAWTTGESFRTVIVSIDPTETPELAAEKRNNYLEEYGRPVGPGGLEFLVGEEAEVRKLADSVGFGYRWDEAASQYAHSAAAFVLTPDGTLSRTLYGISFTERDLRLALTEAGEGKVGSAWDRVLLFCYHYDPSARSYGLAAMRLMRAGGAATLLFLAAVFFGLSRRKRSDDDNSGPEDPLNLQQPELPHAGRESTQAGGLS